MLFAAASTGHAQSYFVATNGSDSNPGTLRSPWATLEHALDNTQAGDTIFVRAGRYQAKELYLNAKKGMGGQPGKMWTLKPYRNESVTLNVCIKIYTGYVRVEGFRFESGGILVRFDGAGHCEIVNNTLIGEFGYGAIEAGGDANLITGNSIEISNAVTSTLDHGIYIHGGKGTLIRNNIVKNTAGYGIHLYDERGYDLQDLVVENNQVYGSRLRSGIIVALGGSSKARDITIRNNVVAHHAQDGIVVRDGVEGVRLYNNTIYDVGHCGIYFKYEVSGILVRNNIIHLREGEQHLCNNNGAPGITVDHNLLWPGPVRVRGVKTANSIVADPRFADAAAMNFRLQRGSPAIDAGTSAGSPFAGAAPDLGAMEFREQANGTERRVTAGSQPSGN